MPVYLSNLDFWGKGSSAATDEKTAFQKLWSDFTALGKGTGTVRVYILKPNGEAFDTLNVSLLTRTETLLPFLESCARRLRVTPGQPLAAPGKQSRPPAHNREDLVLHLVARGMRQGSWREFPSENWFILNPADQQAFLPPGDSTSWILDAGIAKRLLLKFYPQVEETDDVERGDIREYQMKLTRMETKAGTALARIDGGLIMNRASERIQTRARIVGLVRFDPVKRKLIQVQIVTQEAVFTHSNPPEEIKVAVQSLNE